MAKMSAMSLENWSPLFSSILDSSIWGESKEVKILWITLLAKKDADGMVATSLPGLARDAVLTMAECEAALTVLESPDQFSKTPDNDGRRIERVQGGWRVLNHQKYVEEVQAMKRRNTNRRAKQRQRHREAEERAKSDQAAWNSANHVDQIKKEVKIRHHENGDTI